jgi:hypothetical protein
MNVKRGQIIFYSFPLPGLKETEEHPVLIISNDIVCTECNMYVGLMITSSENYNDYFAFELKDNMFCRKNLKKDRNFLRLHLIACFDHSTINKPTIIGEIKPQYIDQILEEQRLRFLLKINISIFSFK